MKETLEKLKAQVESIIPGSLALLGDPAKAEELARLEKKFNQAFPEDVRMLYLTHNGEKGYYGMFLGLQLSTLAELEEEWDTWSSMPEKVNEQMPSSSTPTSHIKKMHYNKKWIPICKDFGGNNIGIDMDPDSEGTVGQVINFGAEETDKYVIAKSLEDFLKFISTSIEQGNYYTVEHEDCTLFHIKTAEIINNQHFFDALPKLFGRKETV